MLSRPAVTPVTMPVDEPTVALPLLASQVPPGVMSFSVVVCPTQTVLMPVIAAGSGLTVTTNVLRQPVEVNV